MRVFNCLAQRVAVLSVLALMVTFGVSGTAQADPVTDAATDWIITKQVQSGPQTGAFQWNPADPTVYKNTQGATALGVLRAYERTGYAPALNSAIANGDCQLAGDACISGFQYTGGDHRFATHDPLFLIELSRVSGDPQYATFVDTYLWQKFAAGTYGASDDMDAAAFATYVLAARTGQNLPEIVAFDLSKMAIAAHLAGESTAEAAFMGVILQSLEAADATHQTFDLPGLASAIWASGVTGIGLDPSAGTWAAANSTADLAATLATWQAPNGGFVYNTTVTVDDANVDLQTTALSMQALNAVDPVQYANQIIAGFGYITSTQTMDGHFGTTYVEGHSETMEAYADIVLQQSAVYVDDDYMGANMGDVLPFSHGSTSTTSVTFGINGFATIADGLAHVESGGQVFVAKGTYATGANISDNVQLIGDGNTASDTVLTETLDINASGLDASNPVLVQNLRITDSGGGQEDGVSIDGGSFIELDNLALVGNPHVGIDFDGAPASPTDHVVISNTLIDGNGTGIRTDSDADVANVSIAGSIISNSTKVGLLLFGAAVGNGTIADWSIDNSQFLSNRPVDTTGSPWGGGIWLFSYGPNAVVDGFVITNSTFADNGSAVDRRQSGIYVVAEGGGQLRDVHICNNTFSETSAGGTQSYGIYVYDDYDYAGYEPIEVCANNVFNGMVNSISGENQYNDIGSNPVVNITGGTIPNTNHVNTPVLRVSDGALFPTITLAINNAATLAGDTLQAPAGIYAETVTLNKSLAVEGAFAGVAGHDASRVGTGESVLEPAGMALRLRADDAVLDGFTIHNTGAVAVTGVSTSAGNDMQFINNRVLDIVDGSGIRFEPSEGSPASGFTISNNLFANIRGDGLEGVAIQLYKGTRNAVIDNNVFDGIENTAIQVNGGGGTVDGVSITNNTTMDSAELGDANQALVITNVDNALIKDNNLGHIATGLVLSESEVNIRAVCNVIAASDYGIKSTNALYFGGTPNVGVEILHNDISGATFDIRNVVLPSLVVGSNWYGGDPATRDGPDVFVADSLAANPIGNALCGDNTPTQFVALAGGGQTTPVNTSFGQALEARVMDALGGAVMGVNAGFAAPTSGASALLATASGSTNFNGVISTAASANGVAGSYNVTASSGSLAPVDFALINTAVGSVTWVDLGFTYDGSMHTPTAYLTEEPTVVCTVSPATVGPNAGAYPVSATCDGVAYDATGDAMATISAAPAVVTLSNLTQTFDGSPKPVTVTTDPAGVAVSVTYNGSATAPSAAGDYAVEATVTDPNYSGSASGTLHITAADAPDLAVTITDDREYAQYGELLTYTITVNNAGNTGVSSGTISNVLPPTLLVADPSWTCVPVGTATCTANGSGALSDTFSVPAGGGLVYLLNAWVNDDQSLSTDLISNTVTVTAAGDVDTSNDSATDLTQAVIFRDGFENGGDGAESLLGMGSAVELGVVDASRSTVLDLVTDAVDGFIVDVARMSGSHGDRITVEAVRLGTLTLVRLRGYSDGAARFTGWTTAEPGLDRLALGMANGKDGYVLLLVGGAKDLQLPLSAGGALGVSLASPSGD